MSIERSVRRAVLGDEPILREVRLKALSEAPGGDQLVTAVIAWARSEDAKLVRLKVIQGNDRARRFYERMGFRATGHEEVRERDGTVEVQMERRVDDLGGH